MQQTWFWTRCLIKYSSGKADEVQSALFGDGGPYLEHRDPGTLFLETTGESSAQEEPDVANNYVATRIDKACELAVDTKLFFIFHQEEMEVYLAKQISIIDDVFAETGERLPRLLNRVQNVHIPRHLRGKRISWIFWPLWRFMLLRRLRLPIDARQQISGPLISRGQYPKFGTLASVGVWSSLIGGGLATGLSIEFGDQRWPYDVSPVCVAAISLVFMLFHVIWKRAIISIDWRPPQYR